MLPEFDMEAVGRATHDDAPEWIHFGAGNIFRAFIASTVQRLLNEGEAAKGPDRGRGLRLRDHRPRLPSL